MKVLLINFLRFIGLIYFPKCTLIVIYSKISYIAFNVLFSTRPIMKCLNSKICAVIYTSSQLTAQSTYQRLQIYLSPQYTEKLATYTVKSGTSRSISISVSNFWPYQIISKGGSFTPTNHGRLPETVICFSFGVRCICASLKILWKSFIKYQPILNPRL